MKRYVLILTALLVSVGILGLPPRFYDASRWFSQQHRTVERQRYIDLKAEIQLETWRFQRVQWRDSVSRSLQAMEPSTHPYLVALPPGTSDTHVAEMNRGIRLHLEAIGVTQPKVPVGVFFIHRDSGKSPASLRDPTGYMGSQEIYVAREGETPFCALVQAIEGQGYYGVARTVDRLVFAPPGNSSDANTLRICGYYARYGEPGAQVKSWLRGGAAHFGSGYNMDRRSLVYLQYGQARGPFGLRTRYTSLSTTALACLAGVGSECQRMFQGGERRPSPFYGQSRNADQYEVDSPVDYFGLRYLYDSDFGPMGSYIFISLEREFGADRFEAFWTSALPVLDAFQSAFGVSADEWVMSWARGLFGSTERGPSVPVNAALLSFLTFGLFGGGALFMGRRKG